MLIVNSLLLGYLFPSYRKFFSSIHNVSNIQERILYKLLRNNSNTEYGEKYGFEGIKKVNEFQKRVPLTDYEDYTSYIQKILEGKRNILTACDVLILEPTGGSTSGSKLIPYTEGLRKEFERGIYPWMFDLFIHRPKLLNGKSYWVITPTGRKEYPKGKKPVGFLKDSEYFGWPGRLIEKNFAVPTEVEKIAKIDDFFYITALYLLYERNLVLLSLWNPTFLLILLDEIYKNWERLLEHIEKGVLLEELNLNLPPFPLRAKELFSLRKGNDIEFSMVWKKLRVISCWGDATAHLYAEKIRSLLPCVEIQKKGLIATEGIVSFPLTSYDGSILSFLSHFYEFMDLKTGDIKLTNQIECGKFYSVILTTSGGLYRYRLYDVIEVVGKIGEAPLIRFSGKEDLISDYFGEKLNEYFVRNVVEKNLKELGVKPDFLLFCPSNVNNFHYTLFIKTDISLEERIKDALKVNIDNGLKENFHYRYARDLGQIGMLEVKVFGKGTEPEKKFLKFLAKKGRKIGLIKPFIFYSSLGTEFVNLQTLPIVHLAT